MLPWKQVVSQQRRPSEEPFCDGDCGQYSIHQKMHVFCWEGTAHQHLILFFMFIFLQSLKHLTHAHKAFSLAGPEASTLCVCVWVEMLIDLLSLSGSSINRILRRIARSFPRLVVRGGSSVWRCVWEHCGSVCVRVTH